MIRTIMIFPEFENMAIIQKIRKQFDPLADLVAPHITLVFPFENTMSNQEIATLLNTRLGTLSPFELELYGVSKQSDRFGNYLFLNVKKGLKEITFIHETLYKNEFKAFDLGLAFTPHMTIGNLPDALLLDQAYESIKTLQSSFHTTINKVSVEMIGAHEESIIIIEKYLKTCGGYSNDLISY